MKNIASFNSIFEHSNLYFSSPFSPSGVPVQFRHLERKLGGKENNHAQVLCAQVIFFSSHPPNPSPLRLVFCHSTGNPILEKERKVHACKGGYSPDTLLDGHNFHHTTASYV